MMFVVVVFLVVVVLGGDRNGVGGALVEVLWGGECWWWRWVRVEGELSPVACRRESSACRERGAMEEKGGSSWGRRWRGNYRILL